MSISQLTKESFADVLEHVPFRTCKDSNLFNEYHSREDFLSGLLLRLQWVPQLFLEDGMRTRYDHVINGLNVQTILHKLGVFELLELTNSDQAMISRRFQAHDIGHHRFGHAGERALSEYSELLGGEKFSNCDFSTLLQELEDPNEKFVYNLIGPNMFNTPVTGLKTIQPFSHKVVKLMDDLENATGDVTDLAKYYGKGVVDDLIQMFGTFTTDGTLLIQSFCRRHLANEVQILDFISGKGEGVETLQHIFSRVNEIRKADEYIQQKDDRWYDLALNEVENCHIELKSDPRSSIYEEEELLRCSLYIAALL